MKDFEYWRKVYLLHSRTNSFRDKVARARIMIERFLSIRQLEPHKVYTTFSTGKDSTAMTHLVCNVFHGLKVVSEKDDMDFPEEIGYLHDMEKRFGWSIDILTPPVNLWNVVGKYDFTEDIHSKGTTFSDKYFYGLLREYQSKNRIEGVFLGLRVQESKGRLWNFKRRGEIYFNKSWQQWVCQPLVTWSAKDVFGYLISNEIPILDIYTKTRFVSSPEEIRKSWVLPSAQSSRGQAVWLKYYYPEIFARLCAIKPKLRSYI
jgi:3'-phosphoadenosine 5'-phosphosulfate sulfotransferase (PAPS reductase)/FAD synthetase